TYFLFKSDRENNDKDSEVQDPLKMAVVEILQNEEIKTELNNIAERVKQCISQVSARTLEKLKEIDENIANTLHPQINVEGLKWQDVFKGISIAGDSDIPINKRGSGVKRLILLSFFRAKAEQAVSSNANVIYAIEEPETSQHTKNQEILIQALKNLSQNTQIIITTHSSVVVRNLQFNNLRIVVDNGTAKSIENAKQGLLSYPSLNEINYLVFDDVSEAYHDELYSELKEKGLWSNFDNSQPKQQYIDSRNPSNPQQKSLTEIIRHQIHHPENKHNPRYTPEQLKSSIELMRSFLIAQLPSGSTT
ncbi:MAG: ATP-binding protein, partial [Neisseriaceae bacterium]|nr:ATP-binding protein [Neisseriaceae bacterium]